jgi:Putative Ig domain
MLSFCSLFRAAARIALLCVLAGTAVSVSSVASATTRTLTIGGTPPASVTNPNQYVFQPVAHDSVQSRLRWFIYNKPAWAIFDSDTGKLVGRPNSHEVGQYNNIKIRLSDWYGYTDLVFSIKVLPQPTTTPPVNTAPSISGHPATSVTVGTSYNFTPTATDAEHNTLTFSIQNKPVWASFNTASGALTGTPASANVGSYAQIKISVSDGKVSSSLPLFTVTVNQMATGNATLAWTPPTENSDGTVLTDLAGYRIHYGTSKDQLTRTATITNPGLTSYLVDQLTTGTWYFSMTAYSTSGTESSPSAVISTTIQ